MPFAREIYRLLLGLLVGFATVAVSAGYWAVHGADSITLREDNPRRVEAEQNIRRGTLVDRNTTPLAYSQPNEQGQLQRIYPYPSTYSIVGYYSLRYGVGGAESAYDRFLRGDNGLSAFDDVVEYQWLHLPKQGANVQLTLDLTIQQAAYSAFRIPTAPTNTADMANTADAANAYYNGSAVVLEVPSGAVLGMVSLPDYNPHQLDQDWERLTQSTGDPFFNRALQGRYQPSGMMALPVLTGALLSPAWVTPPFERATDSITLPHTPEIAPLVCQTTPPTDTLTLEQALYYGCPAPFAELANRMGAESLGYTLNSFGLEVGVGLEGFPNLPRTTPIESPLQGLPADQQWVAEALGQGHYTLSPLHLALVMAALLNEGNAPIPYLGLATQATSTTEWVALPHRLATTPYATAESAHTLIQWLQAGAEGGTAQSAHLNPLTQGGLAGTAYTGNGQQAWFIGFGLRKDGSAIAVVVVLENSQSADQAAQMGGQILRAGE